MNEDLDKMGQTLATIITEVNRNMSTTSNGVALVDETDTSTQNEEEDAVRDFCQFDRLVNSHLFFEFAFL